MGKNKNSNLDNFSIFVLAGMSISVIIATVFRLNTEPSGHALLLFSAFGALMGVVSTVLAANGSIWNFLFGLIDVAIYSYVLFDNKLPSQFLLHVLYFLPMEFVGFFQWKKRGADGKKAVKARRLKGVQWLYTVLMFVVVLAASIAVSYFFSSKGSREIIFWKVFIDGVIATANIVAIVLMALAFMEQWYLWTLVNISSIVLWSITLAKDPSSAYSTVLMIKYAFYFINGLNGIRNWLKLSRVDNIAQ